MNYDIIGDIHGYAPQLEKLLTKMDYEKHNGVYKHPEGRIAIFAGDFIDRGPDIPESVNIPRRMVDAGYAHAIQGNHEYNAICYDTLKPDGDYVRPHTNSNTHGHAKTLKQYAAVGTGAWESALQWFQTLPIYLDLPELRIAHACWDPANIEKVSAVFKDGILNREQIAEIEDDRHAPLSRAVIQTLKGKEFKLKKIDPELSFTDADGTVRKETRIKWWHQNNQDAASIALYDILCDMPEDPENRLYDFGLFKHAITTDNDERPIIFGHYWMKGQPEILSEKIACVDFSVAKDGVLTAYRFDEGDKKLTNDKLIWVS